VCVANGFIPKPGCDMIVNQNLRDAREEAMQW
jgi:hypothetical protein